jgi:DNA-binding MarR family transcriptional regulator
VTPPIDEIQRVAAFRAALRRFERTTDQAVRGAGLTPRQYLLLLAIEGSPTGLRSAHMTEIANALQLARNTASELVDRAAAAGLVRRAAAAHDGRVVRVTLTAAGRRRLAKAMTALDAERAALANAAAALRPHLS